MTIGLFAHYFIIAMFIVVTCIGVAVAQYKIYYGSLSAINIQPAAKSDIMKTSLLCATIAETAAILSLIMAFFYCLKKIFQAIVL